MKLLQNSSRGELFFAAFLFTEFSEVRAFGGVRVWNISLANRKMRAQSSPLNRAFAVPDIFLMFKRRF